MSWAAGAFIEMVKVALWPSWIDDGETDTVGCRSCGGGGGGVGVELGVADGVGLGVAVGLGVGVAVGDGVGVAVADGVGVGVGDGAGLTVITSCAPFTLCMPRESVTVRLAT